MSFIITLLKVIIFLIGVIGLNVMMYVFPMSTMTYIIILFFMIFCSYFLGRFSAQFVYEIKKSIKERHENRFDWYRKMGLQESACLVEPAQAETYWKWSWEW